MEYHVVLGALAAGLQLYSFLPYFAGIFRHEVKPHAFTWLVWALLSGITFAAQESQHAGAGAWMTAVNALACFMVALLSFRYGSKDITRSDWWALGFGLSAIPLWMVTHDPLWSVLIVCAIDVVAFWPTLRKSWKCPHEESIQAFLLSGVAACVAIVALAHVTWVTVLYPACMAVLNLGFITMMVIRRRLVNN